MRWKGSSTSAPHLSPIGACSRPEGRGTQGGDTGNARRHGRVAARFPYPLPGFRVLQDASTLQSATNGEHWLNCPSISWASFHHSTTCPCHWWPSRFHSCSSADQASLSS